MLPLSAICHNLNQHCSWANVIHDDRAVDRVRTAPKPPASLYVIAARDGVTERREASAQHRVRVLHVVTSIKVASAARLLKRRGQDFSGNAGRQRNAAHAGAGLGPCPVRVRRRASGRVRGFACERLRRLHRGL